MLFPVHWVVEVGEVDAYHIQKYHTARYHKGHPPEHVSHFLVIFALARLTSTFLFAGQCLYWSLITFISYITHHFIGAEDVVVVVGLSFDFIHLSFFKFAAVNLTIEIKSFHYFLSVIGFRTRHLAIVDTVQECSVAFLQEGR